MSVIDDALRGFEAIGLMSAQRKAKQRAAAEIEVYPRVAVKKTVAPTVCFSGCWACGLAESGYLWWSGGRNAQAPR